MYSLKKFSHFWNRSLLARIRLDIKREKGEGRRRRKRKRRRKRRGAMAPSRVTSFGLSVRKNEPFGWFAGCHRQFSLVRERPQAVSTRPLGLIDQPGCFRPLGRPRCCGVGQLAADVDMAVCFHVRSITRDVPATICYMLVWKCISLVQQMISCSLRANKWHVSYCEKNIYFFIFFTLFYSHYDDSFSDELLLRYFLTIIFKHCREC